MLVTDITDSYIKYILKEGDLDRYTKELPELFKHYFSFWAQRKYCHKELNEKQVATRKKLILDRLPAIKNKLAEQNFDTRKMQLILMVGQGTTNGHAFIYKNEFAVFLPIESYITTEQVDVFVTHEILHAFHYSHQPDFYFKTQKEKNSVFRQLVTEGLVTYLTKEILNISYEKALWADYLNSNELLRWMNECEREKRNLFQEVKELIKKDSSKTDLFYANDCNDIRKYRAGYFIGMEIVREIVKKNNISIEDLLTINKKQFEKMVNDIL